jgi:hypothetical protein
MESSKIPYFTHPSLRDYAGLHHGFLTRQGGGSTGPYASLNCSLSQQDVPETVLENRERIAALFQQTRANLRLVKQVHSARVVVATHQSPSLEEVPPGDGIVTKDPGILLGILSADCTPILFFDPINRVIGAAHAGWRGALDGVVESTVEAMVSLGAHPARCVAVVGPCIHQKSYEVDQEFREGFLSQNLGNIKWFEKAPHHGHWMFDLPGYVIQKLKEAQVGTIGQVDMDTLEHDSLFFSHRRSTLQGEEFSGRQLSVIGLV